MNTVTTEAYLLQSDEQQQLIFPCFKILAILIVGLTTRALYGK